MAFDIWVLLLVTVVFVPLAAASRHIGRPMGLLFLMVYAAYIAAQFSGVSEAAAALF